ncbi:MAG: bifunctional diaminohydroxyphosphoribosylaminopyrimidine deaminase/5-amino-6-(5-phosphoribosylamino)uracil reductase RibD [Bacteroidetes bacterium]|nr:MAG: bifunctional diaminohydroxyphosphoribosylaminopyrimidine deaminase/5-amino-6-(5-phosphoribosylamino)uracil reductase RibD [Bacteroidota bacterium]
MTDKQYMRRAVQLAALGLGRTAPNPCVGAVIVHNNRIIGEGYHQKYGEAHAEVNAVNSVKDKSLLLHSTMYVTLEPCVHYGKTPPCTNLIVQHKIPRVVVGHLDPFPEVAGKGIDFLRKNGVEVTENVLQKECYDVNRRFFTFHLQKRPYIILKWAETLNGFMAPENHQQKSYWISNDISKNLAHKWRTEEQAVLVGKNTVLKDNPQLNVRYWAGKNPVRVVIDRNLEIPESYSIYDDTQKTFVLNNREEARKGKNTFLKKIDFDDFFNQLFEVLRQENIQSLLVEGGAQTLHSFIQQNYWDEIRVFRASHTYETGVKAPLIPFGITRTETIDDNSLIIVSRT